MDASEEKYLYEAAAAAATRVDGKFIEAKFIEVMYSRSAPYAIRVECITRHTHVETEYNFPAGEFRLNGKLVSVPTVEESWKLTPLHLEWNEPQGTAIAVSGIDVSAYPKAVRRYVANKRARIFMWAKDR